MRVYELGSLLVAVCLFTTLAINTASAAFDIPLKRVSGPSPFTPGCNGAPQTGTNYPNAEVEPWLSINPLNPRNIVGVWQQDRWSNGGANGLLTGVSRDGGLNWTHITPHFTRCSGGNPANGGDYERASDPWVSFGPDGTVFQISLSFDDSAGNQAILTSRSTNGGTSWSEPATLARDTDFDFGLDKETITADPTKAKYAYAVWDKLTGLTGARDFSGPVWFSRTTDSGQTWEKSRIIFDPGKNAQTIGSQIVVLPNGDLVNIFGVFLFLDTNNPISGLAAIRSTDKGKSWSRPYPINTLGSVGVVDPETGDPVRTGDIIPDVAVDPRTATLYTVWQDARFSGGARDGIVFAKSTNGGISWSAPVQINKAPSVQAFTASVDVLEDGTIGVSYYDLRQNTADPNTLPTSYWLVISKDGGQSWTEQRLSDSFDMRTAPNAGGFFVGDYEGLTHAGPVFAPFFAKTNSGNLTNRTDIFITARFGSAELLSLPQQQVNKTPQSLQMLLKSHHH